MDCNLGSEIGQKMRSAVKAKLLELGTGGSSGFIDDELPDYVMVMVANKRTKQQMNAELNLFLGDQTDLFVTWLHEVLQKLQEVTLPTSSSANKKRKSRQLETPKTKDKRIKDKKDKKTHRKSSDDPAGATESTSRSSDVPVISSITDVFAEELLDKAKKSLDADVSLKDELLLKKKKRRDEPAQLQEVTKDAELPTTSEISSTTTSGNREKDIAELAEIQRKIYAAKQHLRQIGELDLESDEADDDLLEEALKLKVSEQSPHTDEATQNTNSSARRVKSPIVFNRTPEQPVLAREKPKADVSGQQREAEERLERLERRSVHDRLGSKPQTTPQERAPRVQKELELYVPAHRRQSEQEDVKKLERGRERSQRNESQTQRRRERETLHSRRSPSPENEANYKQRISSRVIVAVNKQPEPSDDEDLLEKPVSSVIKIKPRPQVSPRRQACKNLLLRAVADAQRSTILAKTATLPATTAAASKQRSSDEPELISSTLGKRRSNESAATAGGGTELFRRSRRELLVNVVHRDTKRLRQASDSPALKKQEEQDDEEEYVPSLSIGDYEAYVPQLLHDAQNLDMDIDMHIEKSAENSVGLAGAKTQFVVTLNGEKSLAGTATAFRSKRLRKRTPSPQVSSTSSATAQLLGGEPSSTTGNNTSNSSSNNSSSRRQKSRRARSSSRSSPSTSSNTPPPKLSRSLQRSEVLRQTQEIKKIIIKHDVDDDEEDEHVQGTPYKRSVKKRLGNASPMLNEHKNDTKPQPEQTNRSTTPPLPPKRPEHRDASREKSSAAAAVSTVESPADTPAKAKHTPIRFKLRLEDELMLKKRRSGSTERDSSTERRRISIRNAEDRKYDNLPALSAVSVDSAVLKVTKPKERCKYHPNCTKQFCEYYHPTASCKSFPNCKFADKCMYSHPKCKFDMSCISIDCNFAHSAPRDLNHVQLAAPPLSSHVIPVQNYKSIIAPVISTTATTMCKYYPNCTKTGCTFYHPKPCRYGKNCINKLECIFYHPEMQSKFKWVASLG